MKLKKIIFLLLAAVLLASAVMPLGVSAEEGKVTVTVGDEIKSFAGFADGWRYAVKAAAGSTGVVFRMNADWHAESGSRGFGSGDGFRYGALLCQTPNYLTLDLNGHTLHRHLTTDTSDGSAIYVTGKLNIIDSVGTGVITGGYNDDAGGAIVLAGSGNLFIKGCSIINCKSDDEGGAIYMSNSSNYLTIDGTVFSGNYGDDEGGAIFMNDGTVEIRNAVFKNNKTGETGGAIHIDEGHFRVYDTVFEGNVSDGDGGAVYIDTNSYSELKACSFISNRSDDDSGGGLYVNSSEGTYITDCVFTGNSCDQYGGGLCVNGHRVFVIGGEYRNNKAADNGGGIYLDSFYDLNLAGKLVVKDNLKGTSQNDLCLQHGYTSTAYLYCGGLDQGSEIWLCATDKDNEIAIKNIDRYQYASYFRFDSGFTVGKIEDVKATSGKVRAEGSAIGHGKRAVVVLMSLGIAAAFATVYIIKKKGAKKDVSTD